MNSLKKTIVIYFFSLLSYQLFAQMIVKSDFDIENHQLHVEITNVSDYIIRFISTDILLEKRSCNVLIQSINMNGEIIKKLFDRQLFGSNYLFLKPNETVSKSLDIPECYGFEVKYEFTYAKLNMDEVTGTVSFQNQWMVGTESIIFYRQFLYN